MAKKTYGQFGKTVQNVEDEEKKKSSQPRKDTSKKPDIVNPFAGGFVQDRSQQMKDAPELYDENGKLNKRYDTNKGQDILAGLGMGARMTANGDPFQQMGGLIGGALGGIFGKNIGGRQRYQQDIQDVNEYNQAVAMKTQATMRAEQLALQQQKAAFDAQVKVAREQRLSDIAGQKDEAKQLSRLQDYIQTTSGADRRELQQQHAKMMGIPDWENVDDDYLVGWKSEKYGDVVYQTTKGGEIKQAVVDGQVVNDIGIKEWVDILAKANKMNATVDAETIKAARDVAITALEPYRKDFKTAKGQFNPVQYNAQIMSLASKVLEAKKSQPDGQLNIPTEISIGGAPVKINLGVANPAPTNNPQPQTPSGNSQFMPAEEQTTQPVADATQKDLDPQVQKGIWDDFMKTVGGSAKKSQAVNEKITSMKDGEEASFTLTVQGVKRTFVIRKIDGKPNVISIQ